MLSNGS